MGEGEGEKGERDGGGGREGHSLVSPPVLTRAPVLWDQGPSLRTSGNLSYLLKGPSPNTAPRGVRASPPALWGGGADTQPTAQGPAGVSLTVSP